MLISYGGRCYSNDLSNKEENNHEEADTLIVRECLKCEPGERIDVFSPDTDVMVLLIGHSYGYKGEINMIFSRTNQVDIKSISTRLGKDISLALISLHAVTGCDTTVKIHKKGKSTWFKKLLESNSNVITALKTLSSQDPAETSLSGIEEFFASVYCPGTKITTVAQARWYLFRKNNADCEKLPPTKGTLIQHVKRAKL